MHEKPTAYDSVFLYVLMNKLRAYFSWQLRIGPQCEIHVFCSLLHAEKDFSLSIMCIFIEILI
jgi:hypothetical protein